MKNVMGLVVAVSCVGLLVGSFCAVAEEQPGVVMEKKAAVTQSVFICTDCNTMALKAGKCAKCQKEMAERHVLGVKDGNAMLCACGATCKCNAAGMKDGKCGCGKEVMKMSVKGMYCCADGCPEIADKPGKCDCCGKELKKVE